MDSYKYTAVIFVLSSLICGYTALQCYVCDASAQNNMNQQVCDDDFLASRGARIESGCTACVKEKVLYSGIQFIKRDCERALRWISLSRTCDNRNKYVYGLKGIRCECTTDYCNSSNKVQISMAVIFSLMLSLYRFIF